MPGCFGKLSENLQIHHGRRISGHKPPTVRNDASSGRQKRCSRRRWRSVNLQLERCRLPEHNQLWKRFPGRNRNQAWTELPFNRNHSGCGKWSNFPQHKPQRQKTVERKRRRQTDWNFHARQRSCRSWFYCRINSRHSCKRKNEVRPVWSSHKGKYPKPCPWRSISGLKYSVYNEWRYKFFSAQRDKRRNQLSASHCKPQRWRKPAAHNQYAQKGNRPFNNWSNQQCSQGNGCFSVDSHWNHDENGKSSAQRKDNGRHWKFCFIDWKQFSHNWRQKPCKKNKGFSWRNKLLGLSDYRIFQKWKGRQIQIPEYRKPDSIYGKLGKQSR